MNQTSHQGKAEKPGEILCLVPQVVARNLFPMGQAMEAQRKVFSCRILSRTVQQMQNQLFETDSNDKSAKEQGCLCFGKDSI